MAESLVPMVNALGTAGWYDQNDNASDIYQAIDEGSPFTDADYIKNGGDGEPATFSLSNPSQTPDAGTVSIQGRVRKV